MAKMATLPALLALLMSSMASSAGSLEGLYAGGAEVVPGNSVSGRNCLGRLVRLRGGALDTETLLKSDPVLRREIEIDYERAEQGKLPVFVENLFMDKETDEYEIDDGVEAVMPPAIGPATGDSVMQQDLNEPLNEDEDYHWVGSETEEHLRARHAREAEGAKKYFEELDAKYYTEKEESDEEMWGDKAILQRRYPPDDDLEDYFEARQEARQIKKFFRSMPQHLKPETPEMSKWLDEWGWNDMMHRNGTRYKWNPEFRATNEPLDPLFEWEEDPMEIRDWPWFRNATVVLTQNAWKLPCGSDYGLYYRGFNDTFDELARMRTLLNETVVMELQIELNEAAGGDAEKMRAIKAFWELYKIKWQELIGERPEWDPGLEKIFADAEKDRYEKFGPPEYSTYWYEDRRENYFGADSSE